MFICINLMIIGNICNLYLLINMYNEELMSLLDYKLVDEKLWKKNIRVLL